MMNNEIFEEVGITLPTMSEIVNVRNPLNLTAMAKFRHHETGWEWYIIADEVDGCVYCFVRGIVDEFGMVCLDEILDAGAMFCPTFQPVKIKDLI